MGERQAGIDRLHWIEAGNVFGKNGDWFKVEVYTKLAQVYLEDKNCSVAQKYLQLLALSLPDDPFSRRRTTYLRYSLDQELNCGTKTSIAKAREVLESQELDYEDHFHEQSMVVEKLQHSVYTDQLVLVSSNLSLRKESEATLELSNTRLKRLVWISTILLIVVIAIVIGW
ncbi:MAG: hypothetical protein ACI837_000925 [Crocinitomicaceae bacterium]|jgi:hypothetical protein